MLRDDIQRIIIDEDLKPGDPLPPEAELMRRLGAGRTAIREAIKSLQAIGIVEIRRGFGTYVGRASLSGLVDGLAFRSRLTLNNGLQDLRELIEVREALETGFMPRVVATMTPAILGDLNATVRTMEEAAARGELAPESDRGFHELLYRSLENNRLLIQFIVAFWNVFHRVSPELDDGGVDLRENAAVHRRIVDAIEARDPARATAAMTEHFSGIRKRLEDAALHLAS